MTDQELIQLLQEKTPEELSFDEIRLLQARLASSDELRSALFEQLEMEQYLAEALGRIELSPETIAARSRSNGPTGGNPVLLAVSLLLSLGLAGFMATVLVIALRKSPDEVVAAVDESPPVDREQPLAEDQEQLPTDKPAEIAPSEQPLDESTPPKEVTKPEATAPQAEPPPEAPQPPPGPWTTGLAAAPRPLATSWFVDFDTSKRVPTQADVADWFETTAGKPLRIHEDHFENVRYGAFQGIAKFKAPWPAAALLRFSLLKSDGLRIHLFKGTQGVTLFYDSRHDNQDRWAAYLTTRDPQEPTPKTWVLTSTDAGRDEYCESRYGPTLLLRWHAGEIILTRGDIEVARAALAEPPDEVFWEGQAAFRGLEMFRCDDAPQQTDEGDVYHTIDRPAELAWAGAFAEPAKLQQRDDGTLALTMQGQDQGGWAAAPLVADRVRLVEIELADIRAGAFVYLGPPEVRDAEGRVAQAAGRPHDFCLTFVEEPNDKRLSALWAHRDDYRRAANLAAIDERSLPLIGHTAWVRFLVTVDRVRCWISPDGQHWALLVSEATNFGPLTHVGIGCSKQAVDAAVTVKQIRLRALPAINALVPAELLLKVPAITAAVDDSQWLVEVNRVQPEGADASAWRRACAIRTLASGCAPRVGQALVELLLIDAANQPLPIDEQIRLLAEAAQLSSPHEKLPGDRQFNLPERYFGLGRRAAAAGEQRPFTKIRAALMNAGVAQRQYFKSYDSNLIRHEIIELAYASRWGELADFVRQLKYFAGREYLPQVAPLAAWAESVSARHLPGGASDGAVRLATDWQHPLVEEYSKEAYNVMAEFDAALESQSYQDAASMIARLDPQDSGGLLPSANEPQLLVSLSTAISTAMAGSPELRAVMNEKFAPLGRLRVNQAMNAGDEAAVKLATMQFHGTKAAADAHGWLGDRALSSGEFSQAVAHYRQALVQASVLEKPQLLARMRLTAAMAGQDVGEPVKVAVRLGDASLAASDFEQLVQEMRSAHASDTSLLTTIADKRDAAAIVPKPTGFAANMRGRLDGDAGENAGNIHAQVRHFNVPWTERQLGIALHENMAYVNNRFHVAAYDLANNGNRLWQSSRIQGNAGQTHDWMLTAMRPVVYGDRVFVRQVVREGPALAAFARQNGQPLWVNNPRDVRFLTDPIVAQGKLFVLTLHNLQGAEDQLRLSALALETGELLEGYDLVRLRDSWLSRCACTATQWEDTIIASLGGLVLCVELSGQLRWVRQQVVLPAQLDESWVTQRFDLPQMVAGNVVIVAPGVRAVECLNAVSGSLVWQRVLPHVNRLISASGDRVIVHAGEELLALDAASGKIEWRRKWLAPLDAELTAGQHGLLLAHKISAPQASNQYCPVLVWFDPQTGEPRAQSTLSSLSADDPRFGPLVAYRDRLWTFFARSNSDPLRDLVELTPQGDATPIPPEDVKRTDVAQ